MICLYLHTLVLAMLTPRLNGLENPDRTPFALLLQINSHDAKSTCCFLFIFNIRHVLYWFHLYLEMFVCTDKKTDSLSTTCRCLVVWTQLYMDGQNGKVNELYTSASHAFICRPSSLHLEVIVWTKWGTMLTPFLMVREDYWDRA